MEKHLKIVVGTNCFFYGLMILAYISVFLNDLSAPVSRVTLAGLGYIAFLYVPYVVGGYGLFKRWHWARNIMILLGAISLLSIFRSLLGSVGAGIGLYTIWVLWQKETATFFAPGR